MIFAASASDPTSSRHARSAMPSAPGSSPVMGPSSGCLARDAEAGTVALEALRHGRGVEAEALERVAVRAVLLARMRGEMGAHAREGLGRELEVEARIDAAHAADRVGGDLLELEVAEAMRVLRMAVARVHALLEQPRPEAQLLRPHGGGIDR